MQQVPPLPVSGVSKNRHNRFNTKQRKTNVMSDKEVTDKQKAMIAKADEAVNSPIGLPGHAWAESEAAMAAEPITEGGEA